MVDFNSRHRINLGGALQPWVGGRHVSGPYRGWSPGPTLQHAHLTGACRIHGPPPGRRTTERTLAIITLSSFSMFGDGPTVRTGTSKRSSINYSVVDLSLIFTLPSCCIYEFYVQALQIGR